MIGLYGSHINIINTVTLAVSTTVTSVIQLVTFFTENYVYNLNKHWQRLTSRWMAQASYNGLLEVWVKRGLMSI